MNYRKEKNAKDSSLLISGVLIGLSFILLVFPLGIYHLAQISALLRRRTAIYLMLVVSFLILLLALITSSVLLTMSGLISIFSIPFFAFGLYDRSKHAHWSRTLLVFFLPVFFILFYIFSLEKMTESDLNKIFEKQSIALQTQSHDHNKEPSQEKKQHNKIEGFAAMSSLEALKAAPAYKTFLNILGMSSLERLSWFIYGPGSSFLLMLFIMVLSCLVFLDFGFDQVERFKAISKYVILNKELFPDYIILSLYRIPELFFRNLKTPFEVISHKPLVSRLELEEKEGKKRLSFLAPLFRRKSSPMESFWQGYSFSLKGKSTWNLKYFSLNLVFVLLAIAFYIFTLLKFQSPDNIISSSEKGLWAYLLVGGGLASFFILTIISMQGLITLYRRLSPGFLLILVICIWLFSAGISVGPYAVIALFSTVGLLDYIYDWRGIKKYSRELS